MSIDMHIDAELSDEQIASYVSKVLDDKKENIFVIHGCIYDYVTKMEQDDPNFTKNFKKSGYICEVQKSPGNFPMSFSIVSLGDEKLPSSIEFAKNMTKVASINCLISSDYINPYHWIYIEQDGTVGPVFVNRKRLDDHNEFVLDGNAPSYEICINKNLSDKQLAKYIADVLSCNENEILIHHGYLYYFLQENEQKTPGFTKNFQFRNHICEVHDYGGEYHTFLSITHLIKRAWPDMLEFSKKFCSIAGLKCIFRRNDFDKCYVQVDSCGNYKHVEIDKG